MDRLWLSGTPQGKHGGSGSVILWEKVIGAVYVRGHVRMSDSIWTFLPKTLSLPCPVYAKRQGIMLDVSTCPKPDRYLP